MMKKNLFLSMFAIASMLFATSCSQNEVLNEASADDYVNAKFTIETPEGIETRSRAEIGDGTTVTYVACAVYDATGSEMNDLRQYVAIENKKAEYSIRLVKGQSYRIAFFAYNGNEEGKSNYYNLADMKNITISQANSNLEGRDAFTAYTEISAEESMQPINRDVYLYRPFAQLNIGAYKEDIEAAKKAGVVVAKSQIKVSNVYTAFNAYDDVVTGNTTEVTFNMNTLPNEDLFIDMDNNEDTPEEAFEYLALNYLLVGDKGNEKSLTDIEFIWQNADGSKTNNPTTIFKNIPVQRNYRTNIIGYLLTNPAVFNIIIDAEFEKPDYIIVRNPEIIVNNTNEAKTFEIYDDIYVSKDNYIHTQTSTADITINGNGNKIISTATSVDDFQWVGNTIPYMSTILSSANGSTVTVNDLTFGGTMSALMLGHYQNSTYNNYNTVLNNVDVTDAKVVSFSQNISPAVCIYGTATLNDCNIYDTTLSELDTDPMWPVYDVAAVNYSTTTVNGGKIGSFLFWNQAALIVNADATIENLVILGNMNNNNDKNYIKINAGATVEVIDLSKITDKNRVKITIENGATVGKIVANGVEYASIDAFKNAE